MPGGKLPTDESDDCNDTRSPMGSLYTKLPFHSTISTYTSSVPGVEPYGSSKLMVTDACPDVSVFTGLGETSPGEVREIIVSFCSTEKSRLLKSKLEAALSSRR